VRVTGMRICVTMQRVAVPRWHRWRPGGPTGRAGRADRSTFKARLSSKQYSVLPYSSSRVHHSPSAFATSVTQCPTGSRKALARISLASKHLQTQYQLPTLHKRGHDGLGPAPGRGPDVGMRWCARWACARAFQLLAGLPPFTYSCKLHGPMCNTSCCRPALVIMAARV
jgi:hypothetical protein